MKILLSSSDAGGANSILVLRDALKRRGDQLRFVIGGPAIKLFTSRKINFVVGDGLKKSELRRILENFDPDVLVNGTSLSYTVDKKILQIARERNIPVISILDSWHNYWQRFSGKKKDFKYMADYICVPDDTARFEMIEEGFKGRILKETGNPYFEKFLKTAKTRQINRKRILFISQPIGSLNKNDKAKTSPYDEIRVLQDIVESLSYVGFNGQLYIRPHPNEKKQKFARFLKQAPFVIDIDKEPQAEISIRASGLVIGMVSILLFLAQAAGKNVISYQPGIKERVRSSRFRYGKLITNKVGLKHELQMYLAGRDVDKVKKVTLIKNAAENVVNLLHSM